MPSLVQLFELLETALGADARAVLLAWARALPLVTIVPAFGLGAVALPIRVTLALVMAIAIAPSLRPLAVDGTSLPFAVVREFGFGLPVALASAALLWAAIMAGGLVDNLRGGQESTDTPLFDEPTTPVAALFGLLVALSFLEAGGATRLAAALAEPRLSASFAVAAERLAQSMGVAVAIAAPLVAGSIVAELGAGLVARSASPAHVFSLLLPLRSLSLLVLLWLSLDRIVELLVLIAAR